MSEARLPCKACGVPIVVGARKCKACKRWLETPKRRGRRVSRSAVVVGTTALAVLAVLVTGRESPVGEAPPLTAIGGDPSAASAAPPPAAIGADLVDPPRRPAGAEPGPFRAREIRVGDVHPLDVEMSPSGKSVFVSADDATLREYSIKTGELLHKASLPAQGDDLRILFDRYVAVLRREDAARIPVMDTTAWDRDPTLLDLGRSPGDILELPDGRGVVAATLDGSRVARFDLPSGARVGDITLGHATGQLFLVRTEGRPHVAALGALSFGNRPAGAWVDLFDPAEIPFGATRRSVPVGRELGTGTVTADGGGLFLADRLSNTATLLRVAGTSTSKVVSVGQEPIGAYLLGTDRFGVTVNASKTATVIDMATMKVESTLGLDGVPRTAVVSADRKLLFVVLGGPENPPRGSGVTIIAGEPPRVLASFPTGDGAIAVSVSKDGTRAAVASYFERTITLLER
jgi:hypothetical protein